MPFEALRALMVLRELSVKFNFLLAVSLDVKLPSSCITGRVLGDTSHHSVRGMRYFGMQCKLSETFCS